MTCTLTPVIPISQRTVGGIVLLLIPPHLLVNHLRRLEDDIVQENDRPLARAHALHGLHQTVLRMYEAIGPREVQDRQELGDVQILRAGDDVEHLIKLVPLDCAADVARVVDRSSVCHLMVDRR